MPIPSCVSVVSEFRVVVTLLVFLVPAEFTPSMAEEDVVVYAAVAPRVAAESVAPVMYPSLVP